MQFVEPNKYIADEGKTFIRVFDGFNEINPPIGNFFNLTLGKILKDSKGNTLKNPIQDKIEYYKEIDYVNEDFEKPSLGED